LLPVTLLECWPQVCCNKVTFDLIPHDWFYSTKTNSMKCFINWILANTHVCSHKSQPCLKPLRTTLQCTAKCYSAPPVHDLQHTATLCNTLQHTIKHRNTLQHTATHCNTLQRTVTWCNTPQHIATHCNTLLCSTIASDVKLHHTDLLTHMGL